MASPASYSVERLQLIGTEEAEKVRRLLPPTSVTLTCEYLGIVTADGSFDIHATTRADSELKFRWRAATKNYKQTRDVPVRCNNIGARGVPPPAGWKTALQNLDLDTIVKECVERVSSESKMPGIQCRLLGRPVPVVPTTDGSNYPGQIITLNSIEYVLCAHVHDAKWLVHRGSFEDENLRKTTPLHEQDLILMDVNKDYEEQPSKKRVRHHLHTGQLQEIITQSPRACEALAAIAAYRAEELRAGIENRELDEGAATCRFEKNPFRWTDMDGRLWDLTMVALWTWQTRGTERKVFVDVRLDNLRERGVPVPDVGDTDFKLWRNLEDVATHEGEARKAPCKYLGFLLSSGRYEPDSSKWPSHQCPNGWRARRTSTTNGNT